MHIIYKHIRIDVGTQRHCTTAKSLVAQPGTKIQSLFAFWLQEHFSTDALALKALSLLSHFFLNYDFKCKDCQNFVFSSK